MRLLKFWPLIIGLFLAARTACAQETISEGLTLKIPEQGSRNWGETFKEDFARPISAHDHSGGGKGVALTSSGFADYTFDDQKIRLRNNHALKSRDAANSTNLDVVALDNLDALRFYHAAASTRSDLGLAIGTNVQAYDAELALFAAWSSAEVAAAKTLADLANADGNFIVGNGAGFVVESGATARTSLGLGSGDSPTFTGATVSGLSGSQYVKTTAGSALTSTATIPSADITGLGTMAAATATDYLSKAGNLSGLADGATSRTNLGLGAGDSPTLTGATLTGLTASQYVKTGSGKALESAATIPSTDITGLGSMAAQDSSSVSISGGSIAGSTISQAVTEYGTTCSPVCNAGYAAYLALGKLVHVTVYLSTTGNPGSSWTFTLPSTPYDKAAISDYRGFGCWGNDNGGGSISVFAFILGGSTTATLRKADGTSWAASGTKLAGCEFSYLAN